MNSSETLNLLRKSICTALDAVPFPPATLPRLEAPAVERTITRIAADDRLAAIFARLHDDNAIRRTFLSLYFHTLGGRP